MSYVRLRRLRSVGKSSLEVEAFPGSPLNVPVMPKWQMWLKSLLFWKYVLHKWSGEWILDIRVGKPQWQKIETETKKK